MEVPLRTPAQLGLHLYYTRSVAKKLALEEDAFRTPCQAPLPANRARPA